MAVVAARLSDTTLEMFRHVHPSQAPLTTTRRATAVIAVLTALLLPAPTYAQTPTGHVAGRVVDESGAALPGVTITITPPSSAPIHVLTDEIGHYQSPPLPPGRYLVGFELSGFEARDAESVLIAAGHVAVVDRRLALAPLNESVEVVAAAPPPAAPAPRFDAPKRPQPRPVPKALLASVCGPGQPGADERAVGTLVAHRDDKHRSLFGDGDLLLLSTGDTAVAPGDNFVVRRRFRTDDRSLPIKFASFGAQTAGLVQIVDVGAGTATAIVVYTCGELFAGDLIEPFDPLPLLSDAGDGAPEYDSPARIIFGEHGQTLAAERQLMVIDRGQAQGAERGQRLTIFRRTHGDRGPVTTIGNAVIIAVQADSATIRIERASDAIAVGDMVALHRSDR